MTQLCLIMIVKNESRVIERCLTSCAPFLSSWSICDTGSTDGTQDIIRSFFEAAGIPGKLHERPWRDFAWNRTESIQLAREAFPDAYGLLMDADDGLVAANDFVMPELTEPLYQLIVHHGELRHARPHIIQLSQPGFRFQDILHEYLVCDGVDYQAMLAKAPIINGLVFQVWGGGDRSSNPREKFVRDAHLLAAALRKEPTNARYAFYLAQSWRDAAREGGDRHDLVRALDAYERRARMIGWDEETWRALYEAARTREWLYPKLEQGIVEAYLKAYEYRPQRIEPLYEIARYYRTVVDKPARAYVYAKAAIDAPVPDDRLFLDRSVYVWRAQYEAAVTSWYAARRTESAELHQKLLNEPTLPPEERETLTKNLAFFT